MFECFNQKLHCLIHCQVQKDLLLSSFTFISRNKETCIHKTCQQRTPLDQIGDFPSKFSHNRCFKSFYIPQWPRWSWLRVLVCLWALNPTVKDDKRHKIYVCTQWLIRLSIFDIRGSEAMWTQSWLTDKNRLDHGKSLVKMINTNKPTKTNQWISHHKGLHVTKQHHKQFCLLSYVLQKKIRSLLPTLNYTRKQEK